MLYSRHCYLFLTPPLHCRTCAQGVRRTSINNLNTGGMRLSRKALLSTDYKVCALLPQTTLTPLAHDVSCARNSTRRVRLGGWRDGSCSCASLARPDMKVKQHASR